MKKIILILAVLSLTLSCDRPSDTPHSYACEKPGDIPDTLESGKRVYWDCEWQGKYNNGDVVVKYNDNGTAEAIMIMVHE